MVNLKKVIFAVYFFIICFSIKAQTGINPYIIYFSDKNGTGFSLNNPSMFLSQRSIERRSNQNILLDSTDLPVSGNYLNQVKTLGIQVIYTLKWINAAYILADSLQYQQVMKLPFIVSQFSTFRLTNASNVHSFYSITSSSFSDPYEDFLGMTQMYNNNIRGDGVLIAITDSGFPGIDTLSAFTHLWKNNQVNYYWDVAANNNNIFDDDSHGTYILSILSALQSGYTGIVPGASYVLLRTEVAATESKLEEFHWLRGAEIADSCGADIISCSLGYTTFDNPAADYTYSDMNGHNSFIAVAANTACNKGILVVCSAGNDGNDSWRYIGTPADSPGALTIGSVDYTNQRSFFSSVGPTSDGRIKPDLCAPGSGIYCIQPNGIIFLASGTSMATPMIAGMAAGIKQSFPSLSSIQLKKILIESGDQYYNPDNYKGYGTPQYQRAYSISNLLSGKSSFLLAPNPYVSGDLFLRVYDFSTNFTIQLTDVQGKLVYSGNGNSDDLIVQMPDTIKSIGSGIYFVSIISDGASGVIKWIKL